MRKEVIGDAELWLGDCVEVMDSWPECRSFDAIVTSPPYDGMRSYGGHATDCLAVLDRCAARISPGGVLMWNVQDQTVDGSETGTSFRHALHCLANGLRLHDTMIYCKEGVTFPNSNRYHPAFEYMFVFSKGAPKHFNGIKDWRNKYAGTPVHGTRHEVDGSLTRPSRMGEAVPTLGLRRNWWVLSNVPGSDAGGHPAPMPFRMAADHVMTWTAAGEIVFDPFMGSGTTGAAALRAGRKFVGIEVEQSYFAIACERIENAQRQEKLFA